MRTIDIISDAICPWCWVGRTNLAIALEQLRGEGLEFCTRWRPYQLNPDMPEEGLPRNEYRTSKFGSLERSRQLDAQMTQVGRSVGLDFHFELVRRTPNTVAAHRVTRMAEPLGLQDAVVDALFRAYFQQGRDIGDTATLVEIAAEAGMDGAAVAAMLAGEEGRKEVVAWDMSARQAGVSGVPSFVMDRHLLFSGAVPPDQMADAFRRAAAILSERERTGVA
jgi:predicted DsbA family dithiol-disulfide isomerase